MKPVEILGKENVPSSGALIVPNILRQGDLQQLERLLDSRPTAYLVEQGTDHAPGNAKTITFSLENPDDPAPANALAEIINSGGRVVFIPRPAVQRPASFNTVPAAVLELLSTFGAPVLPLFVDHPREIGLSVEVQRNNSEIVFSFGKFLEGENVSTANILEALYAASERSYSSRPLFEGNLGFALIHGLKKHGSRAKLIDGLDGSELRYDKLLAAAIALSKVVRQETDKPRIGIVLPPGKGAFIANLAAFIAGKTPVNINFSAGQKAIESSIRQAGIDRFLTADPFVRKMQTFPWPPTRQLIFLERTLPLIKGAITKWFILSKLLPAPALCKLLGIKPTGGHDEAILLFTSGSSGEPKGVVLSHRNILANVSQFASRLHLDDKDNILGCLPLFHSFGCTVTMFFPMLEGLTVVTYPSPLDATKLAPLIEKHAVGLLVATPTFLRGYMRKVKVEQLAGVRYIVSGAEKLPQQFAAAFKERFGKDILEGYGLTETSPVTNVNLPDPQPSPDGSDIAVPASRPGSTGQLMPGLAVRISEPDSGNPLPLDQQGIISFRGANIFEGYHNNPTKTEEVLQDGWFKTGDIGRVDHDGFLYIEGRLSRFSKIGGEMVPHETVEAHLTKALGIDGEDERKIVVVGIPDEQKGEQLILLSMVAGETLEQELINLRYTLLEQGVPSLWIPKKMFRIEDVPHLPSGKLDIKKCQEIAAANV